MSKRELQVGDTVAAYDADGRVTGKITAFGTHGVLGIEDRSGTKLCFHEKQCRRLVRKKPCPPQGERVERWMYTYGDGSAPLIQNRKTIAPKVSYAREIHLVELKPGEIRLDHVKLKYAWLSCLTAAQEKDSALPMIISSHRSRVEFEALAKALGLEAP